jgi:rubrerythrin
MDKDLPDQQEIKDRTRFKASRMHRGSNHWHVRVRTNVITCRACGANIAKYLKPEFCPACGDGKKQ